VAETQINQINFDILIRSSASGGEPHLTTIDRYRPKAEDIEECRRQLAAKGVQCHTTNFGLACTVPLEMFESLFSTQLEANEPRPGVPPWRCLTDPQPPLEIAHLIEQITIPAPPDFF
jgi:hypothetical protein